ELLKVPGIFETIALVLGAALLLWVLKASIRRWRGSSEITAPDNLALLNGLYSFGYFGALVVTMTYFDPATRFQLRILAPVFVSMLLLLAAGLNWLANRGAGRKAAIGLTLLIFAVSAAGQYQTVQDLRRGGQIYANERWYDAQAVIALRALPAEIAIHTNQPGVVYLYVGRAAYLLPDAEPGISQLKQEVLAGRAVIALFKSVEMDEALRAYYDELTAGLYLRKYNGDEIYSAPP
ncbi:MAG TPA: hypothetical protein VGJ22_12670, partial [Anaerolineales bacterium]